MVHLPQDGTIGFDPQPYKSLVKWVDNLIRKTNVLLEGAHRYSGFGGNRLLVGA